MFKNITAKVLIAATLLMNFAGVSFAADVDTDFILGTELTVVNSADEVLTPAEGDLLLISLLLDTDNFDSQLSDASGYVRITKDGNTVVTLESWSDEDVTNASIPLWDGADIDSTSEAESICGDAGANCPSGTYIVEVHLEHDLGGDVVLVDTDAALFTIGSSSSISIESFTITNDDGGDFDPASEGENENLSINYVLSSEPDTAWVTITDPFDLIVKSFNSDEISDEFVWDGDYLGDLVLPGEYEAELAIQKSGEDNIIVTEDFTVDYDDNGVADIEDFEISLNSFDPDDDDAVIEFENSEDAEIWVEILESDGDKIREFDDYDGNDFSENTNHVISWDGKDDDNDEVSSGTYTVRVITRNEYGVDLASDTIQVSSNSSSSSSSTSNSHISGIKLSPSKKFEPSEDDPLEIEWDVERDLDELLIFAVRGSEEIELFDEDNLDEENNLETEWDGTDDDGDYVDAGTWKIEFRSELNGLELEATKTITVDYDEPKITDAFLSKTKFDNDIDEFTYIVFKVSADAEITIEVLEDGDEDDEIVDDMDVEKNIWYAVEWDGDSFDYEDDLDIKITAQNLANDDVVDIEKLSVDLAPDGTITRANITNDFVDPVASERGEEVSIYYELDDDAEVSITIYKGENASGTKVIELLEDYDHEEGNYGLAWDGRDDDGDKLSSGKYSYKIVAKDGSKTDTEKGAFVVGSIGDIDGASGSSSGSSSFGSSNNGKVAPNVIVDGVSFFNGFGNSGYYSNGCAGFNDVDPNSPDCSAITWAQSAGVFEGYGDGSFKPNNSITRVDLLKVIFEGINANVPTIGYGSLGFSDVVAGEWYVKYISYGRSISVVKGDTGKNTFRPNDKVNRAETLKMVLETAKALNGYSINDCSDSYIDINSSQWYHDYVCVSKDLSLFDTHGSQTFGAGSAATRAEVAVLLHKLYLLGIL
jgi:flagellar hook assembly protein FlgD